LVPPAGLIVCYVWHGILRSGYSVFYSYFDEAKREAPGYVRADSFLFIPLSKRFFGDSIYRLFLGVIAAFVLIYVVRLVVVIPPRFWEAGFRELSYYVVTLLLT
jgi:hypothetical protein